MSMILNTVYNNFFYSNSLKSTKYDTHKKSELRSIYNSMVKLNKDAPWHLPTTNRDAQCYAIAIKKHSIDLRNALYSLGAQEEKGLLSKKIASSSNEDIATATFIGIYEGQEEIPSFKLEVNNLAKGQDNIGFYLTNEQVSLPPNQYSFDITIRDISYEFQFSIGDSETNLDIQNRLKRLINHSGIGIEAKIIEQDNKTSLMLSSETTGIPRDNLFIFSVDEENSSYEKGIVSYLGLDHTTNLPENALFLVDGEERSSTTNQFTLEHFYDISLHGIGTEGQIVSIGLKDDEASVSENVHFLTNSYNEFIKSVSNYLDRQPRASFLLSEMSNIFRTFETALEPIGIQCTKEGSLFIDDTLLKDTVLNSKDLNSTFDSLKNFSNALLTKTNQIALNPMNYVEKKVVAYKHPGHVFPNPYNTSAYTGMLFNYYC